PILDDGTVYGAIELFNKLEQAKRPIDKKSKPGGGDSLRRQSEGCVTGMGCNELGEQADRKLGELAKRPIDKKVSAQSEPKLPHQHAGTAEHAKAAEGGMEGSVRERPKEIAVDTRFEMRHLLALSRLARRLAQRFADPT
ncbi:MAG: hypothetical protein RBU37_24760, partial [Myxococcota bacterium]|nr:hypothetical protein [Myxococcota bacterium]